MNRNKKTALIAALIVAFGFGFLSHSLFKPESGLSEIPTNQKIKNSMKLGAFSISLSVADLKVSKQFYEKLGFSVFAGSEEKNYFIMKSENSLIGLFQGMFEGNILTFNPGWDQNAQNLEDFADVREIQSRLKSAGLTINPEIKEESAGPASFMLTDPDGNVILFDQHR